jgi:hypothetical protein
LQDRNEHKESRRLWGKWSEVDWDQCDHRTWNTRNTIFLPLLMSLTKAALALKATTPRDSRGQDSIL